MTQIPDYVRGYRDAFKDVVTLIHLRADEMTQPSARHMVNSVAFQLGEDSKILERRELFQRLRTHIKETGVLPPHLPEQIVQDFEYVEKTIADDRAVRKRILEGLRIERISNTRARFVFEDKKQV
jgi:hypothetical protein